MRLHEFRARNVFGYLNLGVVFDKNPHILIAPNGAGKTTALRLMQALLTPSLRDLLMIAFHDASLRFTDAGGAERTVLARKTKANLVLSISDIEGDLSVPLEILDAVESEVPPMRRAQETARVLRVKYADDPVYRAFSDISLPVFLGLDRRHGSESEGEDYGFTPRNRAVVRAFAGALGAGLKESQRLIQDAYRRVRRLQDMQAERLRKKLLLTGFEYSEFTAASLPSLFETNHSLSSESLLAQKRDLLIALTSIGIEAAEAEKELNPFFSKVIALAERLSTGAKRGEAEAQFEAMINRVSLRRLQQLVGVVRDFNAGSAGLTQKMDAFVKCLSFFFADSRKEVHVDSVGVLKFTRPGKVEIPVEALSSGESQLLIIFSHLFFNSFGDKSNVFVVDEPEVSLHLRWQEHLLEKMVESSPRAQIIVATHSPAIVGELVDHCTGIA